MNCRQTVARQVSKGFTLVEVLLALAIFAALLAFGTPAYSSWMAAQQLANEARLLAETLQRARSEAIKHGYRVNVCKSRDRVRCTDHGGWDAGWLMFVDENHDGQVDDDELVLHREGPAPDGISVSGNRPVADYVSYTSLGHARLLNGGLQMGTFVVCKSGQNALKVVLANSGRARIEKTQQRCS
ncbi:MAG TPA: GspH/FimT family pseudopilin [Casimicrobiaceae bacterium]|nr:GspH/FimT family pseudopilin [Casimicrobiaceae bacterium]